MQEIFKSYKSHILKKKKQTMKISNNCQGCWLLVLHCQILSTVCENIKFHVCLSGSALNLLAVSGVTSSRHSGGGMISVDYKFSRCPQWRIQKFHRGGAQTLGRGA